MGNVTVILSRTPLHEFIYTARGNIDADNMTDDERKRLYHSRSQPLDRAANVKHLAVGGENCFSCVARKSSASCPSTPTLRLLRQSAPSKGNIHRWSGTGRTFGSLD